MSIRGNITYSHIDFFREKIERKKRANVQIKQETGEYRRMNIACLQWSYKQFAGNFTASRQVVWTARDQTC